ncbi:MAG: flagellar motor switch protein FliM [Alphaproteobacteria bacterium]|nr:flagellar motor switch protein FliM [Alphaproteobacteria bacterium]
MGEEQIKQATSEGIAPIERMMDGDAQPTRAMRQDEIDHLLGLDAGGQTEGQVVGIQAMLDKALLTYERLPMLEVVFDRFVRMASTSMRNFTADNVEIEIASITSMRFGDYINSIPMPSLLTMFRAIEWNNMGLMTIDTALVYSMVEVLFGGRKSTQPIKIEGRPYTTIEQSIMRYVSELLLIDIGAAFDPLTPATFKFERLETNPRFATIARPADAVILLQLRVDMEERGGNIEILFPHVTLEPIRDLLTQVFIGEKYGNDTVWEAHVEREIGHSKMQLEAVLHSKMVNLSDVANIKVGSTLVLDHAVDDDIAIRCKGVNVFYGKLGRMDDHVAVQIDKIIDKKLRESIGC